MALPPFTGPAFLTLEDSTSYNAVAASMFIIWDHCITFGQEVDLIWRSKRSIINCLFYAIRYLTFVIQVSSLVVNTNSSSLIHPSRTACVDLLWFQAISGQVLFMCVETVLVIRVFAFYGRSKTLLTFIVTLYVAEVASQVFIIVVTVPSLETIPTLLPSTLDARACLAINVPSLLPNLWVPGLIFESFLFILIAVRFIRTRIQEGISSTRFLVVFVRDGAWAFVLMFTGLLWLVLTFETGFEKGDVALSWGYSMLAFCGTRLILNLRDAAVQKETDHSFDAALELTEWQHPARESSLALG